MCVCVRDHLSRSARSLCMRAEATRRHSNEATTKQHDEATTKRRSEGDGTMELGSRSFGCSVRRVGLGWVCVFWVVDLNWAPTCDQLSFVRCAVK